METARHADDMKIQRLIALDKSKLPSDGGPDFNRLIFARSPYLLQHAENPVDWYGWSDEAFARARSEDKPVFLSIGYATCHWCHVMERESFEDRQVAEVLNRHFVAIKVDREERPDLDDLYMTAAQMITGGGGWPLNVFLTPDGEPFYTVTYVPKLPRQGMPGLIELLEKIADVWKNQRDVVVQSCVTVLDALKESANPVPAPLSGHENMMHSALQQIEMLYDREYGGFNPAPKFPRPLFILFFLGMWSRNGDASAKKMAEHTLQMMRRGGIYDQLGFGFHRYSVDNRWLVPHFEKMLYDQGMLALAYLEAFKATGDVAYRKVVEEIFSFVQREMTSPEGGFYSARDADTEGIEGKYYIWTPGEVQKVLGDAPARTFADLYDITDLGNFEGENILHLALPVEDFAERKGAPLEAFLDDMEEWRSKLLAVREERTMPLRDEKILTAWNGLMIAALARYYAVTGDPVCLDMAEKAVRFIRKRLVTETGRLLRSYYLGSAVTPGFLEDHAFLIWGLLELYEATLAEEYLSEALSLGNKTLCLFADDEAYGLYETGKDMEQVLVRKKNTMDGVIPSGNSVAAMNFLRLGKITANEKLVREGEGILRSFMGTAMKQPLAHIYSLLALDFLDGPDVDITLVGERDDPGFAELLRTVHEKLIPGLVVRGKGEGDGFKKMNGRPAAYVCSAGACRPPVTEPVELSRLMGEIIS